MGLVQQVSGSSSSSQNPTCTFASNPAQDDLIVVSYAYSDSSVTNSAPTDSLSDSFSLAGSAVQSGATVTMAGYVYYATVGSSGADTITVNLGSAPTVVFVTCLEFTGVQATTRGSPQSNTGTIASNAVSEALSVGSFTPTAGDLVYSFGAYTACNTASVISYDSSYTAGSARGTDYNNAGWALCSTKPYSLWMNIADQYWSSASATADTSSMTVTFTKAGNENTPGWLEIEAEFQPIPSVLLSQSESLCAADTTSPCAPGSGFSSSVTSGDVLVVVIGSGATGPGAVCLTVTSVTDSLGTSFTAANGITMNQGGNCAAAYIYYGAAASSGTDTISVAWSGKGSSVYAEAYELADTVAYATTATGSCSGGSCTTSTSTSTSLSYSAGSFLVAVTGGTTTSSWTSGSGFSKDYPSSGSTYSAAEHQSAGSTASTNFPFGGGPGSNQAYAEVGAVFSLPVTQPISLTTASSGPSGTFSLSGCGATPTSVASDGASHTITAANSCSIEVSAPADQTSSRYRFSGASASLVQSEALCTAASTSPCAPGSGFSQSVTSGDLLVVAIGTGSNAACLTVSSVTDTLSTVFNQANVANGLTTGPGSICATAAVYYGTAPSGGSDTISVAWSAGSGVYAEGYEVSGAVAYPTSATGFCTSGCSSPASTSSTSYGSGSFLVAVAGEGSSTVSWTAGSGLSLDYPSSGSTYSAAEHELAASSGSTSFPLTMGASPSKAWAEVGVAFPSSGSNQLVATCSSGTCSTYSATVYYQLQSTYQAAPYSPSTWDTSSGTVTVTGSEFGSSGQAVCTTAAPTSGGSTAIQCTGWADYNQPASMGDLSVSANERWHPATASYTDTSGGNTHTDDYYDQLQNTYSASPTAPTTFSASISFAVTGTVLGSSGASVCTVTVPASPSPGGYSCSGFADYNQAVTMAATSANNPDSNTRWEVSGTNSWTDTTGGNTRTANYYEQLQNTYQASDGNGVNWDTGLSAPVIGTYLGTGATTGCTLSPTGGTTGTASCVAWFDYSTAASFSQTLSGAPSNSRWYTGSTLSYTDTSGGNTHTDSYYKQLQNTYSASDGNGVNWDTGLSAAITGTSLGTPGTTGCSISPTSGTTTASSCNAWFDYNTAASFPQTLSGAPSNSRWYTSSTLSYTDTSGGNTHTDSYYKQLQNTYSASPNAPTTFSASITFVATGTLGGTGSSTICTVTVPASPASGSYNCSGYSDYNTLATLAATSTNNPDSNTRWEVSGTNSWTDTSGGNSHSSSYYEQLQNTYQDTPLAQTTWDSGLSGASPRGTYLGTTGTVVCTIALSGGGGAASCSGWADYSTAAAMGAASTLAGAPSNSQWLRNGACSFTQTTGGNTDNCDWYKQWNNNWLYTVVGGGSPTAPTLSCDSLGSLATLSLSTSNQGFYCDANSSATATDPIAGGTGERWSNGGQSQVVTSGGNNYGFDEYHQFQFTLAYSNSGGGSITAPTLTATQLGSSYAPTLGTTGSSYWLDAATSWSVTNPTSGSGGSERWDSSDTVSGTVSASSPTTSGGSLTFAFYHQFLQTLSYSVVYGGSPSAPTATGQQFGSPYAPTLTTSATGYWFDSSGTVAVSTSTGTNERWAPSPASLSATQSNTQVVSLYHQYQQTFSYNVVDGGTPSAPTATGTQLGVAYSPSLTTSAATYWFDAGGTIDVSTPTNGANERWSPSPASVSASALATQVFSMYHQYDQYLSYSINYGGAGYSAPTASGLQLGAAYSPTLTTSSTGYWFDATGTIAFPNPLQGSSSSERWYGTTTSVSATVQGTTSVPYSHQYLLTVTGGNNVSYGTASPTSDNWYYAGTSTTVSSDWVWSVVAGQSRTAVSNWQLDGTDQNPARQGTGTLTTSSVTMSAAHTVNFVSTTQYLLTVTGGNGITYGTASPTSDGWYDSGASTTVSTNGVYGRGSGTGQRVSSWNVDGGTDTNVASAGTVTTSSVTMSTYHTVNFNSVTQYQVTLNAAATSAVSSCSSPTIANDNYWYDSGATVSCTLNGVYGRSGGTGERVTSYNWDGGTASSEATTGTFTTSTETMSATHQLNAVTVSQYEVSLDAGATSALSSITAPTLSGDNYWYDSGSSVSVTLNGVYGRSGGTGSRVSSFTLDAGSPTTETTTGTFSAFSTASVAAAHAITTVTVTQYLLTDNDPAGSESSLTAPTISGDTGWYDGGTTVTVALNNVYGLVPNTSRNNLLSYTQGGSPATTVTRSGSGTTTESSIDMNAPITISASYVVQYYLSLSTDCYSAAASSTSPTGDGWYDTGASLDVQCNGISARSGGTGKRAKDYYWDSGSTTTESTSGSYTTSSVTMSSAHTLNVDAVTQYQVTFAANPSSAGSASTSTGPPIAGDTGWYDAGTAIDISATPGAYWSFSSWSASSGSITFGSTGSSSTTATIGAAGTITAGFVVTNPLGAGDITPSSPTVDSSQSITLASNPTGGTGVYSYQWYTGASCTSAVSGATGSTYLASPSASTTYYYEVTDSSSATACSAGDSVAVNPALSAGAITPSSPTINLGQSVTLTANPSGGTASYSYQWYTGASCTSAVSGATSSTYSASPTTTTTYYYKVTDSAYSSSSVCSGGDTVTVNLPLTAGAIAPSSPVIDDGDSITLTANPSGGTAPYSYQWYTGVGCTSPISGATGSTYAATPTATTTYYYEVTDGASATACSAGDSVTVNAALAAGSITPSSPTIDSGQSITLTASPSGGTTPYSYQWYTGASCTTSIAGATSSTYDASPSSTTTYYYEVTDSSSAGGDAACSSGNAVTVDPALAAGAITPTSPTIDSGQSVLLTSNPSGGAGAYSYEWYSSGACTTPITGATSSTYLASPTSTTTYYYQVTDSAHSPASACSAGDTVTVNPALSAGAITPSSPAIDSGQSITLTANPSGGTASYSYQWYTGASCTSAVSGATSSTYSASPTTTTTYYYQVTDSAHSPASACSAGDTVTVNPVLGAGTVAPSSPTIDDGQSITLTASPSGGTTPYSYQWYTGASCTSAIGGASGSSISATPTSTTTYYYEVTDSAHSPVSACSAGDTVTVNSALTAGGITPSSPTINAGQSVTLTASPSGGTTPYSYQWYTGAGCTSAISGATGSTYSATPATTTTYYYQVTDSPYSAASACSAGDAVTVVQALSAGSITPSIPGIDSGQSITLTANPSGGTAPYSYQWYTGVGCTSPISGATGSTYSSAPTATTTYHYQVTDSASASACSAGDTVTVNPVLAAGAITPSSPAITAGGSVTLTANPTGGTAPLSYQWYTSSDCSSSPVAGATSVTYSATPSSQTSYYYLVTDASSAGAVSACSSGDTVAVNFPAGGIVVTQPITISPSGGSAVAFIVSGCAASPSNLLGDGQPHSILAIPGCVLTISSQRPATSTERQAFVGGLSSVQVTTCSLGTCPDYSAVYYQQFLVGFQAAANAQASFDAGLSFAVDGTQYGSVVKEVCHTVTSASPTASCEAWVDAGTSATFPTELSGSPDGSRWTAGGGSLTVSVASASTLSVDYYKQVSMLFDYAVVGGGLPVAPTLTCTQLGSATSCGTLGESPGSFWLDSGSSWSLPAFLGSGSALERWAGSLSSGGAEQGGSVSVSYQRQYMVAFTASPAGAGTVTPSSGWYNASSTIEIDALAAGGASFEGWTSSTGVTRFAGDGPSTSATILGPDTVTANFRPSPGMVTETIQLSPGSGGAVSTTVTLSGCAASPSTFSVAGSTTLTTSVQSGCTFTLSLPPPGQGDRYVFADGASGLELTSCASGPACSAASLTFFHQAALSFAYSTSSGSPSPPLLEYVSLGAGSSISLTGSTQTAWADYGSMWDFPSRLLPQGAQSPTNEAWQTSQLTNGTVDGRVAESFLYMHMSRVTFVESGLPTGTAWGVSLDSANATSSSSSISFLAIDGAHGWSLSPTLLRVGRGVYAPPEASGVVTLPTETPVAVGFANMVPVVVNVGSDSTVQPVVVNPAFEVSTSWVSDNQLQISVSSGQTGVGLRLVQIDLNASALHGVPIDSIQVTLDGKQLNRSASLEELLNFQAPAESYLVAVTSSGYEVLVSIPHFSSHVITLGLPNATAAPAPGVQAALVLVLCAAAAVALLLAYLGLSERRGGRGAAGPKGPPAPGLACAPRAGLSWLR